MFWLMAVLSAISISAVMDIVMAQDDGPDDVLSGTDGDDLMRGGAGDDLIEGFRGDDTLEGVTGKDSLSGGAGDDLLQGDTGADLLHGGGGEDLLEGGKGDDILIGGQGADTLSGGAGEDTLDGYVGDEDGLYDRDSDHEDPDLMDGGHGDDAIVLGSGDTATGGSGSDSFGGGVWLGDGSAAEVTDFNAEEDMIVIAYPEDEEPPEISVEETEVAIEHGEGTHTQTVIQDQEGDTMIVLQNPIGTVTTSDIRLVAVSRFS